MSALDGSHPKSISLSMSLGLLNGLHAMKCGTRLYFKKKKKKSDAIRNTALLDGERRNKSRHLSVGRNGIWTFEPQSSFIPFFLSVDSVDPVGSSVVTYRVSLGRYRVSHPSPAFVLFFLQIFSADLEIEDVRSSTRENSHCLPLNRRVVRERDREREPAKTNGIGVSEKCSINTRERESER